MSKYIDDMKSALVTYKTAKQNAEKRLQEIRELYGDEAGERESERQEKQLTSARQRAEAAIREAYSEGVYLAEQWGKLDGGRLTDDVKLLDAGLVDVDAFEMLKNRHRDNGTMMLALKKYGERMNAAAAQEAREKGDVLSGMTAPYNVRDIVTGAEKVENWKRAKTQALDVLDMIDGKGAYSDPWTKALGNALGGESIEHFGENINV